MKNYDGKSGRANAKSGGRQTLHRDGTVSFWAVMRQGWERTPADMISDEDLATSMTDRDLSAIRRHIARGPQDTGPVSVWGHGG